MNPSRDEQDRLFETAFGMSKDELRAQGVDPDLYAEQHVGEVLDDPKRRSLFLSKAEAANLDASETAWRGYVFLLLVFIPLALALIPGIGIGRPIFIGLAALLCAAGFFMAARTFRFQLLARRERTRRE